MKNVTAVLLTQLIFVEKHSNKLRFDFITKAEHKSNELQDTLTTTKLVHF